MWIKLIFLWANTNNLKLYTKTGNTATKKAVKAKENCPKINNSDDNENISTIAGGVIKLGHSLKGMSRPEIDCKFDWPRQISLSNIAL